MELPTVTAQKDTTIRRRICCNEVQLSSFEATSDTAMNRQSRYPACESESTKVEMKARINFGSTVVPNCDDATDSSWEFHETSSFRSNSPSTTSRGSLSSVLSVVNGVSGQSKYVRRKSSLSKHLADLTVNKLQFTRLSHLYGREREILCLESAWKDVLLASKSCHRKTGLGSDSKGIRCTDLKSRRLVTISGAGGAGKSSLASSLRHAVQIEGGFFLQGKCPQQLCLSQQSMQMHPYSAFVGVCNDLCQLVVSLNAPDSPDLYAQGENSNCAPRRHLKFSLIDFRECLNRVIGADVPILTRVIPGLIQVLGIDNAKEVMDSRESIGFHEATHQFKQAFCRFIRAIACFGPVVLVLDDLQWGDNMSLELLEALLSDRESSSLLVIGCYRDDAMYCALPHTTCIERIRNRAALDGDMKFDAISAGNLDSHQVNRILMDLLSTAEIETIGLSECVHRKTLGNAFFVVQFLTMLQDAELLVYNFGALKWTWDLQAIELSTVATDNVVNLMKKKMKSFPSYICRFLPLIACLGSPFSLRTFEMVMNHHSCNPGNEGAADKEDEPERCHPPLFESSAAKVLACIEEEGMIESCGNATLFASYRWVHDKIQEAAFSFISEDALQTLKAEIGEALYQSLEPDELEEHLYLVANLLSAGLQTGSSLETNHSILLAKLFLRAGVKTMETSAFEQAAGYLTTGIRLLPPDHWQSQYELSLELYSSAAEANFCTGHFERMSSYCRDVIHRTDKPLLDKRRVYSLLLESKAAEERLFDALALCRSILSMLGCHFPDRAVGLHVIGGIIRIKSTLKNLSAIRISKLPTMEDEKKLWTMNLLDKFATYAFFCKSALLPLSMYRGIHMTIRDGVSEISPIMFAQIGFALVAFVHDCKGGVAFAEHAIELLKQVKLFRKVESRVLFLTHAFVLHSMRPATLLMKPLLGSYELGMTMGDTESAAWSIYFYLEFSFRTGTPLDVLKADCAYYAEQLKDVKQLKILAVLLNLWQCILHLTGENSFDGTMTGDVVQQEQALQGAGEDYDRLHAAYLRLAMYVGYMLGDHAAVDAAIRNTSMHKGYYEKMFPGIFGLYHLYAFNALSMISLYRKARNRKHLRLAKKFGSRIKKWAMSGVSGNHALL